MTTTDMPQPPSGANDSDNANAAAGFDTGPLSWVIDEIREALGRSKTALFEAGGREREERATALQHARTHLHQAHGALVMVDIDGAGMLTLAAEQALDRFKDGTLEYNVANAQALAELYQALTEYLEDLLAGGPPQPVRLFPYYRALATMLGLERIHPADLFFPPLAPAAPFEPAVHNEEEEAQAPDYPAWRQRFEKSLLPFLKSTDAAGQMEHAGALRDAVKLVADAQQEPGARAFWLVQQGFAELVAAGQLPGKLYGNLYVKQLFGLINLQMRRLTQGTATQPDGMLRDGLFFIALASEPTPLVRQLRDAFRLDGLLAQDYELKRYGQVDQETLARAQRGLARANASWSHIAAQDGQAEQEQVTALEQSLTQVASAADQLKVPALAKLMDQLSAVAGAARVAAQTPRAALGAEISTALLFAGHALGQLRRLPDDFAGNAEIIAARLRALAAGETPRQGPDDVSLQLVQDQAAAALADDMKAALRQAEKALDDFYVDPARRGDLARVAPLMEQVQGALATLQQDHAWRAAQHVGQAVLQLQQGRLEAALEPRALDEIAQNVSALGFFVDMLGRNAAAAKGRFHFDEAAGTFRAMPFEKLAAAAPVPLLDDALPAAAPLQPAQPSEQAHAGADAELLDIFGGEAREVLAFIAATLALPAPQRAGAEHLAMLRRSFHTLKGGSRMIGLSRFADAAGAIERVMNVWLAESRPAGAELFGLLELAHAELSDWVAALGTAAGAGGHSADQLVGAAQRLLSGPARAAANGHGNVIGFPAATAPHEVRDDHVKHVGDLQISLPLYTIYLAESDELSRLLIQDFGEWRHETRRPVSTEALAAVHTLAGSSGTVGFAALRTMAQALEAALEATVPPAPPLRPSQHDVLDLATAAIKRMLQCFALGELASAPADTIAALAGLREQLLAPPPVVTPLDELFAAAYASLSGTPPVVSQAPAGVDADADADADAALSPLDALFAAAYASIVANPPAPSSAGLIAPVDAAPARPKLPPAPDTSDIDDLFDSVFDAVPTPAPAVAAQPAPEPAPEPEAQSEPEPESPAAAPVHIDSESEEVLAVSAGLHDELDADLLPVFLEEGADLMPLIGQALRSWQKHPFDDSQAQMLLRLLHTAKGSARMAGAMRLGQHAHEIETHIENMLHAGTATPQAFEELLAHYDHAQLLFEQLHLPSPATEMAAEDETPPEAKAAMVRVRADMLDRLVNQAGEVSIARSRLENEAALLRGSLDEFSDNLARLRRQLREVEIQAESQIASRMAVGSERDFDPLEFDRFTRLQELTRMMAESVNDVASFHDNLTRSVDATGADLALQARLTRDLQRDLMQVRMVPFASIAERLFRVARQSSKEVDKRVNLDIRGGAVELDRSVLERMAGPFEHLLRNAIVHGVETRAARSAAGKHEIGEMLVQVSQQGNQVVIEFSDDGAGLDLERIKAKARQAGLLADGAEIDDAAAAELIFTPGFSTADSVSELAGRGIGMDVVRSEAQALGGSVAIASDAGHGALFAIHLPLTLAVTQVVLVVCAGRTFAVPSVLVEQVLQLKTAELASAYAAGGVESHEGAAPLHYLGKLLGEVRVLPQNQRNSPVLLLRNGNDRLALHVDEVLGNREVVVKNIGPQLVRMPGIAGATVLGSGDIVLILNPVALAQHLAQHPELLPQYLEAAGGKAALDAGPCVMVVDDSLTVRRVMQRLLEREGYRVLLAKDGIDALEQLQETVPALLLADIEMPRMDGFDLARNVRGDARTRDVPIIMVTSRSADKHRNHALELGVNAYFGKPFNEQELLAEVARLIGPQEVAA